MNATDELDEYRAELRAAVCGRCIERLPNAPPCGPLGKGCGIERHLAGLVQICRTTDSALIDPYIERLHDTICTQCEYKDTSACPCPLDYLLILAVEAVEKVERRRAKSVRSGFYGVSKQSLAQAIPLTDDDSFAGIERSSTIREHNLSDSSYGRAGNWRRDVCF